MNEQELSMRMHVQRKPLPQGFEARQDAVLARVMVRDASRIPVRRAAVFALAVVLLLICGAAAASGYLGLSHFWRSEKPEAEALIARMLTQDGGETTRAVYTVQEAAFDGRNIQLTVEVQAKDGRMIASEDVYEPGAGLAVDAIITEVDGCGLAWMVSTGERLEGGALLMYLSGELEQPIEADAARVTLRCTDHLFSDVQDTMEHAALTVDVPRVKTTHATWTGEAVFEGWLRIERLQADYTPLGIELTLHYWPLGRLGGAHPGFFFVDNAGGAHACEPVDRSGSIGEGFVLRLRCDNVPDTLPKVLTLGVEGLKETIVFELESQKEGV